MKRFLYAIDCEKDELKRSYTLFYKTEERKTEVINKNIAYSLCVEQEHLEDITVRYIKKGTRKTLDGRNVTQIEFANKSDYSACFEECKKNGYYTCEQDLSDELCLLLEENVEIKSNDLDMQGLDIISFDIETVDDVVVSVSFYGTHHKKVLVFDNFTCGEHEFEVEQVRNERELVIRTLEILSEYDIIIGWNVIDFDFRVLKQRSRYYNIPFKLGKIAQKNPVLRLAKSYFSESTMQIPGILVFDGIRLLKDNFFSFSNYKLNTVATEVLGAEKITLDASMDNYEAIQHMYHTRDEKLLIYNFVDSKLVYDIIEKLNLLELMILRSVVTNTPLYRVHSPVAMFDCVYLSQLRKEGYAAPRVGNDEIQGPIEGAFIKEPKAGFYTSVAVLDFTSLYPSIIRTFNIDPLYIRTAQETYTSPVNIQLPCQRGILPKVIDKIFTLRQNTTDTRLKYVLKIILNSFYGILASPRSRFYEVSMAEAITGIGRFLLQSVIDFLALHEYQVIYGDTDSVFVALENKEDAGKLQEKINTYVNHMITDDYKRENYLHIKLETVYDHFFIASKKRYIGKNEKGTTYVGVEAVRGDWTTCARDAQKEFIELLFTHGINKTVLGDFIKQKIKDIRSGQLDAGLLYTKKITKPLHEYQKTTPPHVKAARQVDGFTGRVVEYYVTLDGPMHISLYGPEKHKLDYEHYIEKQLKGVLDDFLEVIGFTFETLTQQRDLFSF